MGIVKIRRRGAWTANQEQRSSRVSELDDRVEEESLLLEKDIDDAWGDSELADVGCELTMVGDRICNIPYELYGLSGLEEILSLETWNSCLTEEERFNLAAYLPDMDQDTFGLTMKELLRGYNLFFGNPVEKFFHGLKGGLYSLHVTCIRDGLQLLHKRRYYHSLRLYHENMAQRFEDMRKTWSNCGPNSTMEERIQIWNDRRDQKPVLLVDLNEFPADEETSAKCDNFLSSIPLLKKTKGKGLLKVRPIEVSSTQTHTVQPLLNRRPPRGVLKIKPKVDTFGQIERPVITPVPLKHCKWHEESVLQEMPFLHRTDGDGTTYRSLQPRETSNNRYTNESLHMGVGPFEISHLAELPKETFRSKNKQRSHIFDYSEHWHSDDRGARAFCAKSASMALPGVEKDLIFPITYKRKKAHTKLNPTAPKQTPMVMELKSDYILQNQ